MAGDWIKMRADLHTHPKIVRISSALKADRLRVVGGLHAVWCLFDAHSEDGQLDGYSPEAVDDLIGWSGFADAMIGVGWMEQQAQVLVLPNFSEHNGQSAKRRAQDAERKRCARMSASDADTKRTREEKRREEKKEDTFGGAEAPDAIWGTGLQYLTSCGVKEAGARSFLGKMRQALDNDLLVAELLSKAQAQSVSDPLAWLRAAAGRQTNTGKTKSGVAL